MNRSQSLRIRSLLFAGAALTLVYAAQGADRTWSNTAGGAFEVPANWVGGLVPGTNDSAVFSANASYAVTFAATVTNGNAKFSAPGGAVTLDVGAGNLYVMNAGTGNGTMRLENTAGGSAAAELVSGTVSVNSHVYIGDQATYNGNKLTVRNSGTLLQTRVWDINVGLSGNFNELLVTNGATVAVTRTVYAGYNTGSNNLIRVTGDGSQLIAATSVMSGRYGDNNRVIAENGATVACTNGIFSIGDLAGADYNSIIVRSGSSWTNGGNNSSYVGNVGGYSTLTVDGATLRCYNNLNVGQSSSFNRFDVSGGGVASTRTHVYIGNTASSMSNTVVVAGSDSQLSTYLYDINVGNYGCYNTLVVSNGATASGWRNIYAGTGSGSSHNTLIVSGANSLLKNESQNGTSYAFAAGLNGTNNALRLEDGGAFLNNGNTEFAVGVNAGSYSNHVVVGGGCALTNNGNLYVGKSGTGNALVASNAQVSVMYTFVGSSNSGNSLTVKDGTVYVGRGHFYLGYNAGANSNAMVVTGSGTVATNTQFDLDVGRQGAYNRLEVSDGAEMTVMRNTYVGHYDGAVSNTLLLRSGTFRCKQAGDGNLIVSNACTLAVQGGDSAVQVRTLTITAGSALDVCVGAGGFTPVAVSGKVTFDATTRLAVDALAFAKAGGGTVTLVTYGSKSGSILDENMTLVPAGITVSQADGNTITLRVPSFKGTIISVR